MRILILCTGNSARSQMAEGLLRSFDAGLEVHSAGTKPAARVHPAAVLALAEEGIDISGNSPKHVHQFVGMDFDFVVTVCGSARETCPVFQGTVGQRLHIGFDDPAAAEGTDEQVLDEFRRVRDEIRQWCAGLYRTEMGGGAALLRPAVSADLPRVRDLLARCALLDDGLEEQFGTGYIVAEETTGLVGVAGVERYGEQGLLRSVAVSPDRQGRGLGDRLLENRVVWARHQGVREVYLLTSTAPDYFLRKGFARVERDAAPATIRGSHEFAHACPASAVVMARPV